MIITRYVHENWNALNKIRLSTITNAHVCTNLGIVFAGILLHKSTQRPTTTSIYRNRNIFDQHCQRNEHIRVVYIWQIVRWNFNISMQFAVFSCACVSD